MNGENEFPKGLLYDHFARHEIEADEEKFMDAPHGSFALIISPENLSKSLQDPGWARVWVVERNGKVIAHASVYDLQHELFVFGHIGIERAYRGQGIAKQLQEARFAFLDKHQLTLAGIVYPGNTVSLQGCLKNGFERIEEARSDGLIWVYRPPGQPSEPKE